MPAAIFCSPDSGLPLREDEKDGVLRTTDGEEVFPVRGGIAYLLPRQAHALKVKEAEKKGWQAIFNQNGWRVDGNLIAGLPFRGEGAYWEKVSMPFRFVLDVLGDCQGKRGLDLAAGLGWGTAHFSKAGAQMVAADFNDTPQNGLGAAVQLRDLGLEFDAVCCDAEQLPFRAQSFDFAFMCSALHHMTRPVVVLRELHRVLKPGGLFLDMSEAFRIGWRDAEREDQHEDLGKFRMAGINEQSFRQRQYESMFRQAGFRVETFFPDWDEAGPGQPRHWKNRRVHAVQGRPGWKRLLVKAAAGTPALGALRAWKLHCTLSDRVFLARKPLVAR